MVAMLVGTNLSAAQGTRAEVEPNNDKMQAEALSTTPGTETVTGKVKIGDMGSFIEQLEVDFQANDPQEDFFRFDVTGNRPVELGYQLGWTPSTPDVDSWILCDAVDLLYTDELCGHDAAASLDNPEIMDNRLFYLYSNRAEEADGNDPVLPESSRYYVTVSNYDPTPAPEANYSLVKTVPAPGTTRTARHTASGFGPWFIVRADSFQNPRNTLRALTRITPPEYPARLDSITFLQFNVTNGPRVNDTFQLLAYLDPDGDGDLSNAMRVVNREARITSLPSEVNRGVFLTYDLRADNVMASGGDIYVGIETDRRRNRIHIPFDGDRVGFYRSPIFLDGGAQSFLLLTSDLTGGPLVSNVGIDAQITINPTGKVSTPNPVVARPAKVKLMGEARNVSARPVVKSVK
jgi:hypothetical protein